jgi:hypothetical protein
MCAHSVFLVAPGVHILCMSTTTTKQMTGLHRMQKQESTATARLGEAKTENCKSRSSSATLILRPLFCVCLLSLFSIGRRCLCLVLGPTSLQKLAFSPGMGNGNGNASPPCDAWRLVIGPLEHPGSCWEGGVAIATRPVGREIWRGRFSRPAAGLRFGSVCRHPQLLLRARPRHAIVAGGSRPMLHVHCSILLYAMDATRTYMYTYSTRRRVQRARRA